MKATKIQILVIGGGYAGIMAALRLAGKSRNPSTEVTLINFMDSFIQRPLIVSLVADQKTPEKSIRGMLHGSRVTFKQGWVSGIDPLRKIVTVMPQSGKQDFSYDYLIYTLGSGIDQDSVPGIGKYAYLVNPYGPRSVVELRQRLVELSATSGIVVVAGGGPTGIEVATEIKARYPNLRVSLVTEGEFGAFRGKNVEKHLRQAFLEQGIPLYEHKSITAVKEREIVMAGGEAISFDVCVWAGGFRPPTLARQAGLAVNPLGQILIDPFGRSISHPDIFAAGDSAHPALETGVPMRMGLFAALTLAAHAADNLIATIYSMPMKPLSFSYYGQGMTLGPEDAVGYLTYPDDRPRGPVFRGKLAVWIRGFAVWLVASLLEIERRRPGSYFWLRGPRPGKNSVRSQRSPRKLQEQLDR